LNLDPGNVTISNPTIGTISRSSVDDFEYTAPHTIAHASVPVKMRLRAAVTSGAGVPAGFYETAVTVNVVRRRWSLNVEFGIDLSCADGGLNSYKYDDDQAQNLRLDDNLFFTAEPFLGGVPFAAEVKGCGNCTAVFVGEPGPVAFNDVGGSLVSPAGYFLFKGRADIILVPAIEVTCPDPNPPYGNTTVTSPQLAFGISLADLNKRLRASDGMTKLTLSSSALGKIIVRWHSLAD
jgi:hypothetical protein